MKPVSGIEEGSAALAKQTAKFMEPPLENEEPAKKRMRLTGKTRAAVPRVPTLYWMEDLRHCLALLGRPMQGFAATEEMLDSPDCPPVLVLCTDQEGLQIAAVNFLKWGANMMVEHVYDPQHRRSNDSTLSLAQCGMLQRCCMNMCLNNLKFGPFLKGGWHTLIVETAGRVSQELSPDDPVLKHFMPSILSDLGEGRFSSTEERRAQFLKELPTMPFVTSKGPKAAMSRFNSVTQAALFLDKYWSSQAFLFTVTCLLQGWVATADQLWQPDQVLTDGGVVAPLPARTCPDGPAASAPAGGKSKEVAKKEGKAALQAMRGKAVNTFHAMTRYLCDPDAKCYSRMLAYLQEAECHSSGLMLHRLRGEAATREQYCAWAHWSFLQDVKEMARVLGNKEKLSRIGFNMSMISCREPEAEDAISIEDCMAHTMLRTMHSLMRFRCGSMLWHTWGLPGVTAGLLDVDEGKQMRILDFLKEVDASTTAAYEFGTLACQRLLFGLGSSSPAMKWLLQRLRRDEFRRCDGPARELVRAMWSSLLNSKLVEDLNKLQREHETRTASAKHVSRMEAWRCGSQHKLLQSYERNEISVTTLHLEPPNFQQDELFLAPKRPGRSESEEERKFSQKLKAVTGDATWPTFTPESQQETFANLALVMHLYRTGGDWALAERAYFSSMLPEGHCISKDGKAYYVVRVYEHGALCWPVTLGTCEFYFDWSIEKLTWVFIFGMDEVKVLPVKAVSPRRMFLLCKRASAGVSLTFKSACTLVEHHMSTGFAGLRESTLKRCSEELGVPDRSSGSGPEESNLVVSLMLHINPLLSEDEVLSKVFSREEAAGCDVVGASESLEEVVRDTVLSSDADKVRKVVLSAAEKREAGKLQKFKEGIAKSFWRIKDAVPAAVLKEAKSKKKAAGKEAEPKKPAGKSKKPQEQSRIYDKLSADVDELLRRSLPPGCRVQTDEPNGRWKLAFEGGATCQKSFSWTACGAASACELAVEQAWAWSRSQTGKSMPADVAEELKALRRG